MEKNFYKKLSFAVIGAGNGGQAIAGYLALKGYSVNLYNRSIERIKDIKQKGYIDLEGCYNGRGILNLVTNNIERAIRNVDVIMVVSPASAHKFLANKIAPIIAPNQYIVLNPGRTGGALEFKNIIAKYNPVKEVCIIEAQTLLFACRSLYNGKVKIFGKKNEVKVSALPATRTKEFTNIIKDVFPEFTPSINVLETSFNNIGAMLHPIPTILNCGRIENTHGNFQYYIDGITPSIARVIEEADYERLLIAKKLKVNTISLMEWLNYTYGAKGNTLCEALNNTKGYHGIFAPSTMETRYIYEDVPQSLVPISDMGRHLGINTPTIDSIIQLASIIHNTDYYRYGRKITDMGLDRLSTVDEIINYVVKGEIDSSNEGVVA
ncbi:NAD/NADP-dependent octopine/nopaline dehydrogenase family protein [Paramaledivibacter caminithermalis]|jgi:opine dehydrogenase|uniref:Opine dehydrogenase n=1 Tax=Paramaledivibacter caminithermalis (strain DSM 15212 / CIP 107654 / DViRD3) TaxID=1121301 RepID=A0A1M6QCV5_PARC5|nr:NAD/NADP-dependent octopine/nopaline dehydrogenase family protein [Paramaledivibacter caminithermalis]SHK18021.1 opine dehydrogenase [Paramaledivibacter caminithermalis DSM 15212]